VSIACTYKKIQKMFVQVQHTQILIKTDNIKRIVAGLHLKQNKTKFLLAPFLMLILVGMGVNHAYATTLSDTVKELDMPDITMNPESGPVGTEITINVSNLPMLPNDADPRLEFYMYLPASGDYEAGLTKCNDHCIILYSFDEVRNDETYPKEITFTLPSVKNSDAYSTQLSASLSQSGIKPGAEVSSVCDVVINGKTQYRFGYSCNNYDTPVGEYEIDFGWAVGMADVYDKRQTVTFTVTDNEVEGSTELTGDYSDVIFKKYEQGEITMSQFVTALKNQGSWTTDEDIRKAISLVGELDHQRGASWNDANSKVESVVSVVDNNSKAKSVVSEVDNNSGARTSITSSDLKTSSEMDDIDSTVVYAIIIGGVIAGGAIFAAFGRNIF